MPVLIPHNQRKTIHNEDAMKRKYKVTYYEYGLTRRRSRKFFLLFSACFFRAMLECTYGDLAKVTIEEIDDEQY